VLSGAVAFRAAWPAKAYRVAGLRVFCLANFATHDGARFDRHICSRAQESADARSTAPRPESLGKCNARAPELLDHRVMIGRLPYARFGPGLPGSGKVLKPRWSAIISFPISPRGLG